MSDFVKHKDAKRHTFAMDVKIIYLHVKEQKRQSSTAQGIQLNVSACWHCEYLTYVDILLTMSQLLFATFPFKIQIIFQILCTHNQHLPQEEAAPLPITNSVVQPFTGGHWRNWQRRGSACPCLILILVPLSCLCPIAVGPSIKE